MLQEQAQRADLRHSRRSARLGLPLAFDDDTCSVMVGDQPFSIRRDGPGDRLLVLRRVPHP